MNDTEINSAKRTVDRINTEVVNILDRRTMLIEFYNYECRVYENECKWIEKLKGDYFLQYGHCRGKDEAMARMKVFFGAIMEINLSIIPMPL
jgi:hypothetical protein